MSTPRTPVSAKASRSGAIDVSNPVADTAAKRRAVHRTGHITLSTSVDNAEAVRQHERMRLAYELHDGPTRRLVEAIYKLELSRRNLDDNTPVAREDLDGVCRSLRGSLEEMRGIMHRYRTARKVGDLEANLARIVDNFQESSGIPVSLELPGGTIQMQPNQLETLYGVVGEALFNAWRHGSPSSVRVRLEIRPYEVELVVSDNGQGFDSDQVFVRGDGGRHLGLIGAHERLLACQGDLLVSSQPGRGTTVSARFRVNTAATTGQP